MRTKLFKFIAAVALVAFAASCAKEQTAVPLGGETEVTFNVASPVFQTKTIADGNTVDKVACCVYDSNGNLIENEISKTIDMTNGKATFSVRLVTGQTYSFIFWAYKASVENGWTSPYTFSAADKTVTVSYDNATSNDESRDAFYAYVEPFQITGAITKPVELKRPFAQINFGVEVDDITAAKAVNSSLDVSKSKVTLTNLGNVLDLVKGTVTGEEKAEFTLGACPTGMANSESLTGDVLKVNDKTYGYVAMNYVLVGKDTQTLTDATLWIADTKGNLIKEDGLKVTNVPLQGNYRTNVLGNLFTSAANFNVVVTSAFEEKDIVKEFVSITAEKVEEANTLIEANKTADIIEVKFAAAPEDITSQAILTTPVKEDGTLNVEISENVSGTLYVGNYKAAEYSVEKALEPEESSKANKAAVNITIPDNVTIEKLVIYDETKTVNINGVNANSYSNTSVIKELDAKTSENTLIIEKGQTIESLTFRKGGLEIHGTVNAVKIQKDNDSDVILVRDCENLSDTVYKALKSYIAEGYEGFQIGKTWNIADTTTPVKLDGIGYATLQEAIDAAGDEQVTISLVDDIVCDDTVTIPAGKVIVLNANGHKITSPNGGDTKIVIYGTVYIADFSIYGQISAQEGSTVYLGSGSITS